MTLFLLLQRSVLVGQIFLTLLLVQGFHQSSFISRLAFTPTSSNNKANIFLNKRITVQSKKKKKEEQNIILFAQQQQQQQPSDDNDNNIVHPQAIGTGYSNSPDLYTAIKDATNAALKTLPHPLPQSKIDLAKVYVTSIYDSQFSPSQVVPAVLAATKEFYNGQEVVQKLIGCYSGGNIGSKLNNRNKGDDVGRLCSTVESEGLPGVVVTFCVLPDTEIKTFHVLGDDVPDDLFGVDLNSWKNSIGLKQFGNTSNDSSPSFMILPSPAFQTDLDDFLRTMKMCFGQDQTMFGALASTVSSLSRARLFRYDVDDPYCMQTLADGCVGVAMSGDVQFNVMVAPGAKPVGGIYRVVSGQESTISAIQLDEVATNQLESESNYDEDDEEEEEQEEEGIDDRKKRNAAAYAKAIIPKPVLAEANYVMKTLSDDDQAFMRKSLLLGLERGGGAAKTANELLRLAEGDGHSFTVMQVASAGMKDGSVTLPLGSVDIELGARLRFFVRDNRFAKKEIKALWLGHKKKILEQSLASDEEKKSSSMNVFNPSGCFVFPTLDRGAKYFGDASYESNAISEYSPSLPSISGFFCNGAIAALDEKDNKAMIHGSASCYVLVGSKSNRPVYSHDEAQSRKKEEKVKEEEEEELVENTASTQVLDTDVPAPRSDNGELIVRRREIHSGRALTVSNVEWSVVENTATPTSALEGFMWDKETEVDRFRERVPLANLVSQCKLYEIDPSKPKPRDWVGAFKRAAEESDFVIIPELKRLEPKTGSLRKRYDLTKLSKQIVAAKSPVLSVNCDAVFFGGSMEDVTTVREKVSTYILDAPDAEDGVVAPPILASDLLLYPYQLYKLRIAGTDAVNLIVGALTSKDLLYLSKIAATLKIQVIASVTSVYQIKQLNELSGGIDAIVVSNRDLETFGFDDSGEQALSLLRSDAMEEFKQKFGTDVPILVEGRVGLIQSDDGNGLSANGYIKALKDAGAVGAIIGSGLTGEGKEDISQMIQSLQPR